MSRTTRDLIAGARDYVTRQSHTLRRLAGHPPLQMDLLSEIGETIGGIQAHLQHIYDAVNDDEREAEPMCAGDFRWKREPGCDCGYRGEDGMTHATTCALRGGLITTCACARPGEARERHADHCPVRRGA